MVMVGLPHHTISGIATVQIPVTVIVQRLTMVMVRRLVKVTVLVHKLSWTQMLINVPNKCENEKGHKDSFICGPLATVVEFPWIVNGPVREKPSYGI